jgi:hypothetical protein
MRLVLRTFFLLAALAALLAVSSAHAEAQAAATDPEAEVVSSAHGLRDAGAGLTIAGLASTGLGVGLMFGITGFENYGGIIAGGVFEGLGGALALAGIPTWIAGGVRSDVLGTSVDARAERGWQYELSGIVITMLGIATCLVGGGLIAGGIAGTSSSSSFANEQTYEAMRNVGGMVLIPVGFFLGTFIGAPLWAEGARF